MARCVARLWLYKPGWEDSAIDLSLVNSIDLFSYMTGASVDVPLSSRPARIRHRLQFDGSPRA